MLRFPIASYADSASFRLQVARDFTKGYVAQLMSNSEILVSRPCTSLVQAQQFLLTELNALHALPSEPLTWKTIHLPITNVLRSFLLLVTVLYGLPTVLELIALHAGGQFSYLMIGDLFSYIVIFFAGYRWTAVAVYLLTRTSEVLLIHNHLISYGTLLWVTDAVPSLFAAALLCRKLLFLPK